MKRLIVLMLIVFLLAGGGVAAWWLLLRDPGEGAVAEPAKSVAPTFIEFTPLVLPIIREGQVTHHATYKIVLEVGRKNEDQVIFAKRRLADAFFAELHGLLALRYVRELDNALPLMQKRLLAVSDRMLGAGVVDAVLLAELGKRKPKRG